MGHLMLTYFMFIAEWNIALGKIASQSSVRQETQYVYFNSYDYNDFSSDSDEVAEKAIDGCKTRSVQSSSCCARTDTEDNPWWTLDLGTVYSIGKIAIHRKSGKCVYFLYIFNSARTSTF